MSAPLACFRPRLSFGRAIQCWGEICSDSAVNKDLLTLALYDNHQGTLHIEGIPLRASHIIELEGLIHIYGMQDALRNVQFIRCELGKRQVVTNQGQAQQAQQAQQPPPNQDLYSHLTPLQALIAFLHNKTKVQSIDLSANALDNQAMQAIIESLANHKSLQTVILEDNRLQGRGGGRLISTLLEQHPAISTLNLCENDLQFEGALELAPAFATHGNLVKLDIACCGIEQQQQPQQPDIQPTNSLVNKTDNIYFTMAESLIQNPKLKDLRWSVGEVGADVANSNSDLVTSDKGMLAVAHLLEQHPSLQSLAIIQCPDFLCPQQPQDSSLRLTQALGNSCTLERFAMEGCGISDDTVAMFCQQVLMRNPVLQHLDLLSNDLCADGHDHFNAFLPRIKHLRSLAMEGSTMEDTQDFVNALTKNTSLTQVCIMEEEAGDTELSLQIDRLTERNMLAIKTQEMLKAPTDSVSNAVWGQTLTRLAMKPHQGLSSMYQVICHKLWVPQNDSLSLPPLRKRQRLGGSKREAFTAMPYGQ